jgi:hypothetical protein
MMNANTTDTPKVVIISQSSAKPNAAPDPSAILHPIRQLRACLAVAHFRLPCNVLNDHSFCVYE